MSQGIKKILTVGIILLVVLAGVAYYTESHKNNPGSVTPSATSKKSPIITTSFYPMYFFARAIAGDKADVVNITPAAAEPHDYEPTAKDIARIQDSDLLILNGGKLEPWGDNMRANLTDSHVKIVVAGDALATRDFVGEDGKTATDPHVWLDPVLAKEEVNAIVEALDTIDPSQKSIYDANAATLLASLDQIDAAYHNGLVNCKQNTFVTSHAAFGYLADQYGVHQLPIAGLSPDAEPSPKELADVAAFVTAHHVQIIFFESLVSPKLSETIANEVGAKTMVLNPIEGLTNEELSAGKTYITEMTTNLDHLRTALQCQ